MSGRRTKAAVVLAFVAAMLPLASGVRADPVAPQQRAAKDVESTSSVTLGRLSVKMLGVDRPWDPHICIGCDGNSGAPRTRFGHLRSR